MSKKSEIYDAVASSLEGCCDGPRVYIGEDVPVKKFNNACKAYAEYVGFENCVGMTDETVFGSGKKGFLFTYDGFYYDGEPHVLQPYSEGYSFNCLPELYDLKAMNRLLKKLKSIVGAMPDTVKLIDRMAKYSDQVPRVAANSFAHMEELLNDYSDWDDELMTGLGAITDFFIAVADGAIGWLEMVDFPDPDSADAGRWMASYFVFFVCLGALLSRDRELYKSLEMDAMTPEREQAVFADIERTMEIAAPFMTWGIDWDESEWAPVDLAGHVEEFHREAVRVHGLLDDPDKLDMDGLRQLFGESKQALERLLDGVQDARSRMVSLIEMGC